MKNPQYFAAVQAQFNRIAEVSDRLGDISEFDILFNIEVIKKINAYEALLPTFQEFFQYLSNKEIIEAAHALGFFSRRYSKRNPKKYLAKFRKVLNLFRTIPCSDVPQKERKFCFRSIFFGSPGTHFWVEYFWDPLPILATEKLNIEDYPPAELAASITDYIMQHQPIELEEFLER